MAFDDYYEMFMGTKGTLILRREIEALFFPEGNGESGPTSSGSMGSGTAARAPITRPMASGGPSSPGPPGSSPR